MRIKFEEVIEEEYQKKLDECNIFQTVESRGYGTSSNALTPQHHWKHL